MFVAAVGGFPFHVPVFVCGDGSGFGGGLVTHDAEGVVDEEGGDVMEVVSELAVGFGDVGVFPGRRFEFDDDDRNAVYEDDDVGAFFCVVDDGPLVYDGEGVVFRVVVVDEVDEVAFFFVSVKVSDGDAVLEVVGCDDVFVDEGCGVDGFETGYGFGDGGCGFFGVDFLEGGEEVVFEERVVIVAGDVRAVAVGVTEALDEFEDGVFEVGFGEGHE